MNEPQQSSLDDQVGVFPARNAIRLRAVFSSMTAHWPVCISASVQGHSNEVRLHDMT